MINKYSFIKEVSRLWRIHVITKRLEVTTIIDYGGLVDCGFMLWSTKELGDISVFLKLGSINTIIIEDFYGSKGVCSTFYDDEKNLAKCLYDALEDFITDLPPTQKNTIEYYRSPTEREVRFGEGATHYRAFDRALVTKRDGTLKKWFIADDGLRYTL